MHIFTVEGAEPVDKTRYGFFITASKADTALENDIAKGGCLLDDIDHTLVLTGNGDVLEPENGLAAIGSGGAYAQSSALALLRHTELEPKEIVKASLSIAGDLCIYTNQQHVIEVL